MKKQNNRVNRAKHSPAAFPAPRQKRPRIETATPIVPQAVATGVWTEACQWLEVELPRPWIRKLATRANMIYGRSPQFRRSLNQKGTTGRDWLWAFTRHWLAAMIRRRDPNLYSRLPVSFSVGIALPIET